VYHIQCVTAAPEFFQPVGAVGRVPGSAHSVPYVFLWPLPLSCPRPSLHVASAAATGRHGVPAVAAARCLRDSSRRGRDAGLPCEGDEAPGARATYSTTYARGLPAGFGDVRVTPAVLRNPAARGSSRARARPPVWRRDSHACGGGRRPGGLRGFAVVGARLASRGEIEQEVARSFQRASL